MDRPDRDDAPTRGSYHVELVGVSGQGRRGRLTAALALLVIGAVVVGGLVSSGLFPVDRGLEAVATPPAAGSASAAAVVSASSTGVGSGSSSPASSPDATQPATPEPTSLVTERVDGGQTSVAALLAAIPRHGTGPLAIVDGRLHATPRPCASGAALTACLALAIDGVAGVRIVPDNAMGSWPGDPLPSDRLVLLPRDGRLVYLGSVRVDPAGIPRIDLLMSLRRSDPGNFAGPQPTLFEADGVLISVSSPCQPNGSCPVTSAALLAVPPASGSPLDIQFAVPVHVEPGAAGVATRPTWASGPYLLRLRADAPAEDAWQVVAREELDTVMHVVIPRSVPVRGRMTDPDLTAGEISDRANSRVAFGRQ